MKMLETIKMLTFLVLLAASAMILMACNTVAGVGEDTQAAGRNHRAVEQPGRVEPHEQPCRAGSLRRDTHPTRVARLPRSDWRRRPETRTACSLASAAPGPDPACCNSRQGTSEPES